MRRFLLRLYPAAWRDRYGAEFEALLEERSLTPFDVADVFLAAVDAHVHRPGPAAPGRRRGPTMSRHLGGTAAIFGSCLLVASQLVRSWGFPAFYLEFVILAGMLALVVAMAALSSIQSRHHPIATWAAFGVAAAGMVVFPIWGIAGYFIDPSGAWFIVRLIAFLAVAGGSAAFAALTYRTGAAFRPAAALLALSGTLLTVGVLGSYFEIEEYWLPANVGYFLFPLAWIALGYSAVRLDRRLAPAA